MWVLSHAKEREASLVPNYVHTLPHRFRSCHLNVHPPQKAMMQYHTHPLHPKHASGNTQVLEDLLRHHPSKPHSEVVNVEFVVAGPLQLLQLRRRGGGGAAAMAASA